MNSLLKFNPEYIKRLKSERKGIRTVSNVTGLGMIAWLVIPSTMMSALVLIYPLYQVYIASSTFQSALNIVFSIFGLLIPFAVCGMILNKITRTEAFKFNRPVSYPLMLAAVPFGFFACLVANYVTSWIVTFTAMGGAELTSPEYSVPGDVLGRIVYVVSIAVVPPLVEEFAIRGAVMQPLRKYGDTFAIVASSIVFAVIHGNLVQAPFAFMVGLILGYMVCVTNSIWTGVIIHFCNNFYAVTVDFMIADITDEARLNFVYTVVWYALFAVSIMGSLIFVIIKIKKGYKLYKSHSLLDGAEKMRSFIFTVPMIISIISLAVNTMAYVDITNGKNFAVLCLWLVILALIAVIVTSFIRHEIRKKKDTEEYEAFIQSRVRAVQTVNVQSVPQTDNG